MSTWGPTAIAASADDAFSKEAWAEFHLTGATVYLGAWYGCNPSGVGLRFLNVTVPAGDVVDSATLRVQVSGNDNTADVGITVRGQAHVTPATFSTLSDYTGRTRTTASVPWSITGEWVFDSTHDSPDLAAIITEIIGLPSWASGNNLVLFLANNSSAGWRGIYSYDNDPSKAAKLTIVHHTPAPSLLPRTMLLGVG